MKVDPEKFADIIGEAILAAVAPLAARITTLGQRPVGGVEWAGTFMDGKIYEPGQLTTRSGSLWLCVQRTAATPGANPTYWKLVAKGR